MADRSARSRSGASATGDTGAHIPRAPEVLRPLVHIDLRRQLLEARYGLTPPPIQHYRRPVEHPFTASQRERTTVLLGGLSPRHDRLVEATLRSLGYDCQALPPVTIDSYTAGRHYGDNGLCNPTYFTVGNLIRHLEALEASGMTRSQIIDTHVFVTAGSCGTCRFGMFEAQYRLALANAGFDGFRVIAFGMHDGIDQSDGEGAGLDTNLDFFLGVIAAFDVADVLNQLLHRTRAYEVVPGSVDAAMERIVSDFYHIFERLDRYEPSEHWTRVFLDTRLETPVRYVTKVLHLMTSDQITAGMRAALETLDRIELEPFRVRPIVKLIGEFWAQVTEGAGNFHMHRFLEREGAEVYVDRSLFMRLAWDLHQAKSRAQDRKGIRNGEARVAHYLRYYRKIVLLTLAQRLLKRENDRLLEAAGGALHPMVLQTKLEEIARPYWNWRTTSGESHLEIAENIYSHTRHLCHMVLSVKPFGCMPSTQSDGVQARVVEDHPGMIFLPVETAGDGEVMAHSRVQMALGPARAKAQKEMADVLSGIRWSLEDLKAYADDHPHVKRVSYRVPHRGGVVGRAANLACHVGDLLDRRPAAVSMAPGSAS